MANFSIGIVFRAINQTAGVAKAITSQFEVLGAAAAVVNRGLASSGPLMAGGLRAVTPALGAVSAGLAAVGRAAMATGAAVGRAFDPQRLNASAAALKQRATEATSGGLAAVVSLAPAVGMGKVAMDWEKRLGDVATMTSASGAEIRDRWQNEMFAIARDTGMSLGDLGEGAYQALSAAVPEDKLMNFLQLAGRFAKIGRTDMTTAVNGMTSAMNAFGISTEEAGSSMFAAQVAGKTDFGLISQSIGQVAPIAKNLGVQFNELMGGMAAITQTGLPTSEAFTAIRAVLVSTAKQTKQQQTALAGLGIRFDVETIRALGFQKALQTVVKAVKNSTTSEAEQIAKFQDIFGRVEGLNALFALDSTKGQEIYQKTMDMSAEKGDLLTRVEKQRGDLAVGQWKRLKVELEIFSVEMMSRLLPAFFAVTEAIRSKVLWLKFMGDKYPKLAKTIMLFIGVVVAGKIAMMAYGMALSAVAAIKTVFASAVGLATAATVRFTAVARGATAALTFMFSTPWGLLLVGIAGGIALVIANWDKMPSAIQGAIDRLKEFVTLSKENEKRVDSWLHPVFEFGEDLGLYSKEASGASMLDTYKDLSWAGKNSGNANPTVNAPVNVTINTTAPIDAAGIAATVKTPVQKATDQAARQSFRTVPGQGR